MSAEAALPRGAAATPGVLRGCGRRQENAVYLECGMSSSGGVPLNHFFIDPPRPATVDSKVGVELVKRGDVFHILDWIGVQHYPYAADFLVEGAKFGFSRRVPKTLDFSRLTADSRLIVIHAAGLVTNHPQLRAYQDTQMASSSGLGGKLCPLCQRHHSLEHFSERSGGCIRDLWALPEVTEVKESPKGVSFMRKVADIRYRVLPYQPSAPEPETTSAIVAMLPVTNISVIKAQGREHAETFHRIKSIVDHEGGISVTEQEG